MSLLTLTQIKSAVGATTVSDDVLQILLDSAEADLITRWGAVAGPITERPRGGSRILMLRRPVLSITSVTDITSSIAFVSTDYFLRPSGMSLLRLPTGRDWPHSVEVISTPVDDTATRKRIQIGLVKLDLTYSGLTSQRIGDYAETKQSTDYIDERRKMLDSYVLPAVP